MNFIAAILLICASTCYAKPVPHTALNITLTVQLPSGAVEGQVVLTTLGKKVDRFLGIPYGEAPTGRRRFQPSTPARPWKGVLDAKHQPPACYQHRVPPVVANIIPIIKRFLSVKDVSEDCLKLNVWKPHGEVRGLPVLVWIYGGGFVFGSTEQELYQGELLSSEHDLVVVTMNYRMASLGFLYLGTEEIPGNAGLYDQLLALKWVQENIEFFGGDPSTVTLAGQSAGAASVGYHMLSPLSRGLFRRAILQSGTPLCDWAYLSHEKAIEESMKLVDNLGCPKDNVSAIAECLQQADPEQLISNEPIRGIFDALIYKPTVDYKFLLEEPAEGLRKGRAGDMEVLLGQTKNEGSYFLVGLMPLTFFYKENLSIPRSRLDSIVEEMFPWAHNLTRNLLTVTYNDWREQEDGRKTVDISEKIISDFYFTCPINGFARALHTAERKVYRYYHTQDVSRLLKVPKWLGVMHAADLLPTFGLTLHDDEATGHEMAFTRRFMKYWTNFVKFG